MRISDLLSMCARNLARRKFRTFLTVMGVVIGTSFIVLMISLGIAISENNRAMLESWGDLTVIRIENRGNTEYPLTDAAIARIGELPGVSIATTSVRFSDQVTYGNFYAGRRDRYSNGSWGVICMEPESLEKWGFKLLEGEWLSAAPPTQNPSRRVVRLLAGKYFAYGFYDTKKRFNNYVDYWNVQPGEPMPDPFFDMTSTDLFLQIDPQREGGKTVRVQVEIVGILDANWQLDFYEDSCIMALEDMRFLQEEYNKANGIKKDRNQEEEGYSSARVKCASIDDVSEVEQAIHDMGFTNTRSMEQERKQMQEQAQQLQLILGIIGGVALFIAALSIMNTMIMSVYERTREIGVMKVLGCVLGKIRAVFLLEAGLIGLLGGFIGDGLSYCASYFFNKYGGSLSEILGMGGYYYGNGVEQKLSVIPPWLMLLGLVFATCVGLVSGIIPAMRAVKISALEAIRTE